MSRKSKARVSQEHPVSPSDLRLLLYAQRFRDGLTLRIARHLSKCELCQDQAAILMATDPILIGASVCLVRNSSRSGRKKK